MRWNLRQFGRGAVRLFTHNLGWKLVALAGAVVIWALVANEPELSTFSTVRLEFRNLPSRMEISSQPMETVTLELRGPAGELRGQAENRRPSVVLDMSDVQPGERTYEINGSNVSLPRGVHLVRAFPAEVRFDFEQRAKRQIPVQVKFAGPEDHNYVIAGYTVSPSTLEIEGPASHVARAAAATTDVVSVPEAVGTSRFRVNAFLPDSFLRFEKSPQVEVTVTVKRR